MKQRKKYPILASGFGVFAALLFFAALNSFLFLFPAVFFLIMAISFAVGTTGAVKPIQYSTNGFYLNTLVRDNPQYDGSRDQPH